MAVDIFLDLEGIKGEAQDSTFKDKIEVLAFSWGLSQAGTFHSGGGGGAGKVNAQDLSFTHYLDSSSPNLMKYCCSGEHIPKAVLHVRKAGGKKQDVYFKFTMTKVMVTSVSTGGSGGEDRFTENVSLNFSKGEAEYKAQQADGSLGAPVPFIYDFSKNVA